MYHYLIVIAKNHCPFFINLVAQNTRPNKRKAKTRKRNRQSYKRSLEMAVDENKDCNNRPSQSSDDEDEIVPPKRPAAPINIRRSFQRIKVRWYSGINPVDTLRCFNVVFWSKKGSDVNNVIISTSYQRGFTNVV